MPAPTPASLWFFLRPAAEAAKVAVLATALMVASAGVLQAQAQEGDTAERPAANAVLVELYTSQGCYSCPPADALLQDLAAQAGVVALEFHVDYWDDLIYGFAGSWEDPFSDAAYTYRQQRYSRRQFSSGMYTPQFILHGQAEVVGSRASQLEERLAAATDVATASPLQFYLRGTAAEGLTARVDGTLNGDEDFFYAVYLRAHTTEVTAGENKGATMHNTHIVQKLRARRGREITIPPFDAATQGCAVWVQRPQTGKVIGAANCSEG